MTWTGPERRKEALENMTELMLGVLEIKTKLENLHGKVNNSLERIEGLLARHSETLYGNGHSGLTSKIDKMEDIKESLQSHQRSDNKWFFFFAGMLITILGWTIFK